MVEGLWRRNLLALVYLDRRADHPGRRLAVALSVLSKAPAGVSWPGFMTRPLAHRPPPVKQNIPRSFKDLTPSKHFNPRTFFRELVWKALLTRRTGEHRIPAFPKLAGSQVAVNWIGHASFLIQFTRLNVLIAPNFPNWPFLLKPITRS